ncbi:hypothetical protein [Aeromicrobium sp.]|uniref:hypothetical protein n=1 Tax=Aeromicrobium sp. TaxID=1871063 RepID=UPI0030BF5D4B
MLNRARTAALTLAALTLAGCTNIHPGDAAVVDGQSISMKTLNETAEVYCALTLSTAQEQGATVPGNADIRRQAVTSLVSLIVARKLAGEEGIAIKPSTYEVTTAQEQQIADAFPDEDTDQIVQAIEDNQEVSTIAIALGEQAVGQPRTQENEAQLAEAGQAEITKAFATNDVEFAPRFGLDGSTKQVAESGSLSVSPADPEANPDQLPAAQRCS